MRNLLITLLAAAAVLLASSSQAGGSNLPTLGDASARALSTDQEAQIGIQIMRQLRSGGYILDDPELEEYVQSLGQRLASHSNDPTRKLTFFVVDSADFNAFALPGGYIGINAGMIMATNTESELAGVVAHEIAHVTQRHIARRLEQQARLDLTAIAGMLAGVLVGLSTGEGRLAEAAIMAGSAAQMQGFINYTRAHEHEADRIGIGTLAAAGYDPEGMVTMFEQMERRARLSGVNVPDFLSTHPVSAARISEARDRAASYSDVTPDHSRAYPLMRARARVLVSQPRKSLDHFTEALRDAPASDRAPLTYGKALALTRSGNPAEARELLRRLVSGDEDVMYYHTALAAAEFADGNVDAALARYERAMRLFPKNLAVTRAYAETLMHAGRGRDAMVQLLTLLPQQDPNPELYRLLALSSGAAGELADAHYFMSEVYVQNGQLMPAIDQLRIALAISGINEQQRLRMEARLEQLVQHVPRRRRAGLQ